MKFYIETFGCKVNAYESNYIKESLLEGGFVLSDNLDNSDIVIVNTCTVTNTADKKCLKFVRKVKKDSKKRILIVIGCSSQNKYEEYKDMDIDILLGTRYKSKITELLKNYLKTKEKYSFHDNNRNIEFENMEINDFNHARAFIKIQDGCDNFCSYCIIPFVRGSQRSKNFDEIVCEAKRLVLNNHREIVLTGIHTGSYNYEGKDLVDVIDELSKIDGLKRIRLSSVEITELNDKFLNLLRNNNKLCDHLHIPLQSGSNKILNIMKRNYDMDYFFNKIDKIRKIRPDISITTDIIVGHPGENDSNFKETYENAKKIGFSKIHVFPYSKRNGTKASKMDDVLPSDITKRSHQLLELSSFLEKKYSSKFNGKKLSFLVEEVKEGKSIGHTSNYLKMVIDEELNKNEIYEREFNC